MLKGQIALVTGASRGIGRAIALDLGREGATVIGTATTEAGAADIQKALEAASIQGWGAVLNVTDAARSPRYKRNLTFQHIYLYAFVKATAASSPARSAMAPPTRPSAQRLAKPASTLPGPHS